jgi:hyperosmotically inducible protein
MNMRHAHRWASVTIACVVFASAGCDKGSQDQAQSFADDAVITTQVHEKAAAIDVATVSLMHVKSERGAVTLTGTVKTQSERTAIEKAARGVSGVHSVNDEIVVDANAPTGKEIEADLELAARVHTALIAQTGVNAARVHVDVHRAVVTLTGSLPSAAHREVADQTVRTVPGVAKVIDKIAISKT